MKLTTLRVSWTVAFAVTIAALAVVVWGDFDRHVDLDVTSSAVIVALATSFGVAGIVLPGRLYASALARLALRVTRRPLAAQTPGDYRRAAPSAQAFDDEDAARAAMQRAFRAPFLVGLLLGVAVALLGLVLAQGRFAPSSFALPLFAMSWSMLALRFPRVAHVVEPAERVYAAALPSSGRTLG